MSNVSIFHTVEVHTDSKKALADQRLAIVTFKTPKDKKDDKDYRKPTNVCVSIPKLKVQVQPEALAEALQSCFEDLQDACIRKLVTDAIEKKVDAGEQPVAPYIMNVSDDQISFEAVAEYAAANAVSGKLSKKGLESWFDECLADSLQLALANVMQMPDNATAEQLMKLESAVKQHKLLIAELASPRAMLNEKVASQLLKAVKLAESDKVRNSLIDKLQSFLQPKEVTIALGL